MFLTRGGNACLPPIMDLDLDLALALCKLKHPRMLANGIRYL